MRTTMRKMPCVGLGGKREDRHVRTRLQHLRWVGFDDYTLLVLLYDRPSQPLPCPQGDSPLGLDIESKLHLLCYSTIDRASDGQSIPADLILVLLSKNGFGL